MDIGAVNPTGRTAGRTNLMGKKRLALGILGLRHLKDVQVEISWSIRPELR